MGALVLFLGSAQARDPNVLPRHYDYGRGYTMPNGEWTGGDTFLVIALPIAVVMVIALPHVFDGEFECWPVWKFTLPKLGTNVPKMGTYKFPTRSLCESI